MDSVNSIDPAPLRTLNVPEMRVHRQLMRFAIRTVLYMVLAWLALALLWAFLPSPNPERADGNGVDYPTRTLLSGKTLTRVYRTEESRGWGSNYGRSGFALDYQFDPDNLTIRIGQDHILPLFQERETNATEESLEIRLSTAAEHKRAMIEKEVLSLRHEIQKGVLSPGQRPEIRDVERTSELLEKLESCSYLDTSVIKRTKIDKVLKVMSKLPDRASLDDLIIQKRATTLLKEWNMRLTYPQHAGIIARLGDKDGANLPWFRFADAVLLYWWIHKDVVTIPIIAKICKWSQGENDFRNIS
ncbi:hypothetical protein HYALB_00010398 [Hymenoscyphus albidus]|uniref:Uncharacterized protein n=1 Tax=Hymenoscyphus albidus TaxID=595503 RepID=A0A9N9LNE9_9HELO|nr:hypothetical protein HYALB_00010398 [Hymenoscyphus albidus]